jgi:beta-lactamase regulating signal transducer with metallopeptidase domain
MQTFWETVVSNSLLVVVLAMGLTLLGRIWKNPSCLHLLWLLVLLKLVTPPLLTLPLSSPARQVAPVSEGDGENGSMADQSLANVYASEIPGVTFNPEYAELNECLAREWDTMVVKRADAQPVLKISVSEHGVPSVALRAGGRPWFAVLAWIWGAGIILFGSSYVYRIFRFRCVLRVAGPPSIAVLCMAERIAKRFGMRRTPPIRMLPVCISPLVWSLGVRTRVLLPSALFEQLNPAAQEAILAHELAHVQRKDHWIRLLEMALTTLFWWHPIVWWAVRRLQELEDQCCDSAVVRMTSQAESYAAALLDTLDFLSDRSTTAPLGAAAARSSVSMARRITMLKIRPSTVRMTAGRLAFLLAVAAIPITVALGQKPQEAANEASEGILAEYDGALRQSAKNLRDITSTLYLYQDVAGHFPAAQSGWGYDRKTGEWFRNRPYLSWRVLLLPLIGEKELFRKFRTDEPWDSEHNRKLIPLMPSIYRAPGSKAGEGKTNYLGVCGMNTAFSNAGPLSTLDFEGTTSTIMLVEVPDEVAVEWTRPLDFELDAGNLVRRLVGLRNGGFLTAFADGAPQFVSEAISPEFLQGLMARQGNKAVSDDPPGYTSVGRFERWLRFIPPAAGPAVNPAP